MADQTEVESLRAQLRAAETLAKEYRSNWIAEEAKRIRAEEAKERAERELKLYDPAAVAAYGDQRAREAATAAEGALREAREEGDRLMHDNASLRTALAAARAEFQKQWDDAPETPVADLMRIAVEAFRAEHERFKDRGGELDAKDAALAAAQGALDEAVKLAAVPWDPRASAGAVQRGIVNQLRMLRDRALNPERRVLGKDPRIDPETYKAFLDLLKVLAALAVEPGGEEQASNMPMPEVWGCVPFPIGDAPAPPEGHPATETGTICPQCVSGAHDKCLTNPEEGMECFCPDQSHAAPAPGAGEQRPRTEPGTYNVPAPNPGAQAMTHEEQLREALRELVKAVRDYSAALRAARITSETPSATLREATNEVAIRLAEADAALSGKREGAETEGATDECPACHAPLVYCGGEWRPPPLQTLTGEQLAHHHKPITRAQFEAALERGRRDVDALERATPRRPGTFTTTTPAAEVGAEARGAGPPHDAPEGKAWACMAPRCESWATLRENAHAHQIATGHGRPVLLDQSELAAAPEAGRVDNVMGGRKHEPDCPWSPVDTYCTCAPEARDGKPEGADE